MAGVTTKQEERGMTQLDVLNAFAVGMGHDPLCFPSTNYRAQCVGTSSTGVT